MTNLEQSDAGFDLPKDINDVVEEAVSGVLKMLNLSEVTNCKESDPNLENTKTTISGVIGFVQEGIEGTLTLTFNRDTIQALMSKMYGVDDLEILDERILAGVGELTNQVFGFVKNHLYDAGFKFKSSIPVIIVGPNHQIFKGIESKSEVTCFETPDGPLGVTIKVFTKKEQLAS